MSTQPPSPTAPPEQPPQPTEPAQPEPVPPEVSPPMPNIDKPDPETFPPNGA